jgi:glycosyltransferase involved in cell wall biosynthesis
MNVIYDISPLGIGYRSAIWRTGISRVVENVAVGLIHSQACELCFSASESFAYLADAIAYAQSHPSLRQVPIPHAELISNYAKLKSDLYQSLDRLTTLVKPDSGILALGAKVFRRILYAGYQGLCLFDRPLLNLSLNHCKEADIFHSTFFSFPSHLATKKPLKRFLTVYDLIPLLYPQFFSDNKQHILRSIIQQLTPDDWIICISHNTKKDLLTYRSDLNPSNVFVTHLAASNLFYPCSSPDLLVGIRQKYSIPEFPYILSLSTLEPRKNISHTIRCFARLIQQENLRDFYLVIVGEKGWNYDEIFASIPKSLSQQIVFTGYVANEDLAALYSGALAFVYPSLYEGFGLPPLEAMQCGTPVITSNTSSLPEVVGEAGIMISPTDEDGLCQQLLNLYQHPSLRETLSVRSLQQAGKFSWERCVQETIAAYTVALTT